MPAESINICFCYYSYNFSFKKKLSFFLEKIFSIYFILYSNKYYTNFCTNFGTKQVVNKVNTSRTVSQRWQENISQIPEGISSLTSIFGSDLRTKVQLFKSTWAFDSYFTLRALDPQNLWGSRIQDEKPYWKSRGFGLSKARFLEKYLGT